MENKDHPDVVSVIVLVLLAALDILLWRGIASAALTPHSYARAYFLDVGQGDSEMIMFPDNVKVMTDAGPDDKVLTSLAKVMPLGDDYIDIAIVSHPQLDHFNGYNFILDHYRIGTFIYNGRNDSPGVKQWPALLQKIRAKHIPLLTLGANDKLHYGTANEIDMLSPSRDFDQSAELNDTGFVELVKTKDFRALLTADIGFNVEDFLISQFSQGTLHVDIVKVPHHGSNYSSGDAFLRATDPKLAVIEVGAHNTYGHPGKQTLARYASSSQAKLLRTDQNGTIEAWEEAGKLKIIKER